MAFVPVVLSLIGPLNLDEEEEEDNDHAGHKIAKSKGDGERSRRTSSSVATSVAYVQTGAHPGAKWAAEEGGDSVDEEFHTPKPSDQPHPPNGRWPKDGTAPLL